MSLPPVDNVPPAAGQDENVLITSDVAKLPPTVAVLLNPSNPLPPDVRFFETRFDIAHLTTTLLLAAGFALATIVIVPVGVALLFDRSGDVAHRGDRDFWPLGLGILCAFVTWVMLASAKTVWSLRARQLRGEHLRLGTFLTPDAFVQASENDTTIIPPACLTHFDGRTITYQLKGVPKTFRLPNGFVDASANDVHAAIAAWIAGHAAT